MNVESFLSHRQMSNYSSILPLVFMNGAPHALIAKTKCDHPQGHEAKLLHVL